MKHFHYYEAEENAVTDYNSKKTMIRVFISKVEAPNFIMRRFEIKPGGIIVLNTPRAHETHHFKDFKLATADVTAISVEAGLPHGMVNTGIIGSLERAANLLGIALLIERIEEEFRTRRPEKNALAARLAYERTATGG